MPNIKYARWLQKSGKILCQWSVELLTRIAESPVVPKSGSERLTLIQDAPPLIPDFRRKGQTSKGIWPDTTKGSDTNDKFHPFCDGGKAIQTLLGWKNQFYFYFHKSHLLLYLFVAVFVGKYFQFWQKRLLDLLTPPSASLQNHHHHDNFDIDMSRPVLEVVLRVGMIWNLGNWLWGQARAGWWGYLWLVRISGSFHCVTSPRRRKRGLGLRWKVRGDLVEKRKKLWNDFGKGGLTNCHLMEGVQWYK